MGGGTKDASGSGPSDDVARGGAGGIGVREGGGVAGEYSAGGAGGDSVVKAPTVLQALLVTVLTAFTFQ